MGGQKRVSCCWKISGGLILSCLVLFCIQGYVYNITGRLNELKIVERAFDTARDVGVTGKRVMISINTSIHDADRTKSGPSDWILTSYMRSGSSFTGQLLGHRLDTFYWFEPLFAFHIHFWSDAKVCYDAFDRGKCRPPASREPTTRDAVTVVQNILSCNLSSLGKLVGPFSTAKMSGVHWKEFELCQRSGIPVNQCLLKLETPCKTALHRSMKLLRLTVDNTAQLLDTNLNLKVVHLFRDPRAIMNSRLTTNWYNFKSNGHSVLEDARLLCQRMLHEARAGEILRRKYPDRFGVILYEDLISNLRDKSRFVFHFLNIDVTENSLKSMRVEELDKYRHTVEKKNNSFINWWYEQMDYKLVHQIDVMCRDIYVVLGYLPIRNIYVYRNTSNPTNNLKKELLLEKISSKTFYHLFTYS